MLFRSEKLINLGDALTRDFINKFINTKLKVLYEEKNNKLEDSYEGYTTNYIRTRCVSETSVIGYILDTKIKEATYDILKGEILV